MNRTLDKPPLYPPGHLVHDGSGTVYRVARELGHGGMGVVYEVVDRNLNVRFAMKMLLRAEHRDRFETEARVIAQITHRNVVEVVRLGRERDTGRSFFVMRWIDGQSLQAQLKKHRRFSLMAALNIARDILSGVEELHRRGVIHCDLKPANVILSRGHDNEQTAKLIDFGIARLEAEKQREAGFTGTPAYASLEQIRNQEVTRAADVYSAGVILYEMLAGARPFASVDEQLRGRPESLQTFAGVPRGLDQLVTRMLAPKAADRPPVGPANARIAELFLALARGSEQDPRVITLQSPQVPATITRADISAPTDPDGDSVPDYVRLAREEDERRAVLAGENEEDGSSDEVGLDVEVDDAGATGEVESKELALATTGRAPGGGHTWSELSPQARAESESAPSVEPPSRETNVVPMHPPPTDSGGGGAGAIEYLDAHPSTPRRARRRLNDTVPMNGPPLFFEEEVDGAGRGASPVPAVPAAPLAGQAAVTPTGGLAARTRRADQLGLPPAGVRLRPDQKNLDRRAGPVRFLLLAIVVVALLLAAFLVVYGRWR